MTKTQLSNILNLGFINVSQLERDAGLNVGTLKRWKRRFDVDRAAGMHPDNFQAIQEKLEFYKKMLDI